MVMASHLRIHAFLPSSLANGPGQRAVIWVQGCTLGCPGCFNPETHPAEGGEWMAVDDLIGCLVQLEGTIEGITISGGEPLQQLYPLLCFLSQLRERTNFTVLLFTGYTLEEVQQMPNAQELLSCVDVLFTGRYNHSQRLGIGLCGSLNKGVHFLTNRYTVGDLEVVPPAEVLITPEGEILVSGIDPPYIKVEGSKNVTLYKIKNQHSR